MVKLFLKKVPESFLHFYGGILYKTLGLRAQTELFNSENLESYFSLGKYCKKPRIKGPIL